MEFSGFVNRVKEADKDSIVKMLEDGEISSFIESINKQLSEKPNDLIQREIKKLSDGARTFSKDNLTARIISIAIKFLKQEVEREIKYISVLIRHSPLHLERALNKAIDGLRVALDNLEKEDHLIMDYDYEEADIPPPDTIKHLEEMEVVGSEVIRKEIRESSLEGSISCPKCLVSVPSTAQYCPNCGSFVQTQIKKTRLAEENESGETKSWRKRVESVSGNGEMGDIKYRKNTKCPTCGESLKYLKKEKKSYCKKCDKFVLIS